ncbi:tRNA 2-thiocytidine(32) synthetase TtcA [Methylophilaceae bacterium]|nr:tRNA 2-thiocytidine(32) synthetase TtcA [Methylophilaceae bacterium]
MNKDPFLPTNLSGNFIKLRNKLISATGKAIADFNMIEDKDVVMVCLSGGKDSYTLLSLLFALKKRAPIDFSIIAMNLDQKQPGFPENVLPDYLNTHGVDYKIISEDTYSIVKEKIPEGKTTCSLCSRLRRGIIYRVAREIGANKIALGHHKNDIVETFFMNMFFGSKLKSMPPKLLSDDQTNVVIRPLAYIEEKDIITFSNTMNYPIIPCNLCGSQENLQRNKVKSMLNSWEKEQPGRLNNIFQSLMNVEPSHLADTNLYDFKNLKKLKKVFDISNH